MAGNIHVAWLSQLPVYSYSTSVVAVYPLRPLSSTSRRFSQSLILKTVSELEFCNLARKAAAITPVTQSAFKTTGIKFRYVAFALNFLAILLLPCLRLPRCSHVLHPY